jgi:tRNA A37 threonylcarbamoyladenosine biosynthesis protein TsaE
MKDKIVTAVTDKFQDRSEVGQKKYGASLERDDLNLLEWLNHLQEELMDATLYVEKLKQEIQSMNIEKESYANADKITHNGFVYIKYDDIIPKINLEL